MKNPVQPTLQNPYLSPSRRTIVHRAALALCAAAGLALGAAPAFAQTPPLPTITVRPASHPAREFSIPQFHARLDHATNTSAQLFFNVAVSGSAANTSDIGDLHRHSGSPSFVVDRGGYIYALSFTPHSDNLIEGDETLTVTITSARPNNAPPNYRIGTPASATVILPDDNVGIVTIIPNTDPGYRFTEGGSSAMERSAAFTVRIAGGIPTAPVRVPYTLSGISAADVATQSLTGIVEIPANRTEATLVIAAADDAQSEGTETMTVTLGTPTIPTLTGARVRNGTTQQTAHRDLLDNDVGVSVRGPGGVVAEGDTAVFLLARGGSMASPVTVEYQVEGVDADDFRDPGAGQVIIPAGAATATIELSILEEHRGEGDETLRLRLIGARLPPGSTGTVALGVDTAEVAIPGLEIGVALSGPELVQEGNRARFRVLLSPALESRALRSEVVVGYALGHVEDSAQHGEDYRGPLGARGTMRIAAGELVGALEVAVHRDGELEGEEEFSVVLEAERSSSPEGLLRLGTASLRVRIVDGADGEAHRERRTRALLGATHRAATQMATEVIAARWATGPQARARSGASAASADRLHRQRAGQTVPRSARAARRSAAEPSEATQPRYSVPSLSPSRPAYVGGSISEAPQREEPLALRFAQRPGGSHFALRGDDLGWDRLGEDVTLWGAGSFRSLEGDPALDGRRLDYQGESYGFFVGADQRIAFGEEGDPRQLLAGAALGWTRADLDFRDGAAQGFALSGRFESELLAIHPYLALRPTPHTQLWLLAGYGWGDVEIEERERAEGAETRRGVETDTTLWMVSAGAEGRVPLPAQLGETTQLLVRLAATRSSGSLARARFDDGALLRGTRARGWRVAGELEGSHGLELPGGAQLRPFVTARLRGDAGDDLGGGWELAVDLGGGADLRWPARGLELGVRGTAQLNAGAGYREHSVAMQLRYDLGGDGRGWTAALESAMAASATAGARGLPLGNGTAAPGALAGDELALAGLGAPGFGVHGGDLRGDLGERRERRHSLQGELGYGLPVRPALGGVGLMTPYARFALTAESRSYATGLRFESPWGARLGLEGGLDLGRYENGANYRFTLRGELPF